MKFQSFSLAVIGAIAALSLPAFAGTPSALPAATPPPTPPPVVAPPANATANPSPEATDSATPAASPLPSLSPGPKDKRGRGDAHPAAPIVVRKGLEGVWEVQIQRGDQVTYAHFHLQQLSDELIGVYQDTDNKKYPMAGSLDGKQLRLVVSKPDGTTLLFEATVDGTTDMLGLLTDAKGAVPFTAAYRAKESWMDNLNTQPGGLSSGGSTSTGGTANGGTSGIPPQ